MGHKDIRVTLKHYARFLDQAHTRNVAALDELGATWLQTGQKADSSASGDSES